MDVGNAILARRSVRSYQDEEIPQEKLEKVLNSVRMAPSAYNKQDWKFVVVRDEETKEKLYESAKKQSHVKEAPVVIAGVSTEPEDMMSCGVPGGIVHLAIALDHLSLKATEEGLGTCWIGAFYQDKAKEALEVPDECEIVSMMTLGYPQEPLKKREKDRKGLEEVVSYRSFATT